MATKKLKSGIKGEKRKTANTISALLIICGMFAMAAMAPGHREYAGKDAGAEISLMQDAPKSVKNISFKKNFTAGNFTSVLVDDNNTKWFLTDKGIASFDGSKWQIHNKNKQIPVTGVKDFAIDVSSAGRELWLASPAGATAVKLPITAKSAITTYNTGNSELLSDTVRAVAVGKGSLRWFGTNRGVSAYINGKWLSYDYELFYPEVIFRDFPITAIATNPGGDSVYVATDGAGVGRMFRNEVDAISGASEYAIWGPIDMPSDNVHSICITPDGTKWFGTDLGIARHIGNETLAEWTVFDTNDGLVDNFVQCIACYPDGSVWFGTKGGISIFRDDSWKSLTSENGLLSNNIQCMTVDKTGVVWCGTDKGVIAIDRGVITNYRH